jgi:hypothetical protein
LLRENSALLLGGYKIGIELLIVNGLITFLGLWLISGPGKPKAVSSGIKQ